MLKSALALFSVVASCLTVVNGHGSVGLIKANGKTFRGPLPNMNSQLDSPIREIKTLNPITDLNSPDMACGPGAAGSAKAVAEVTAGTSVDFGWTSGPSLSWPHRWGPVLLYAYKCPGEATDCAPPNSAEWFLIDAAGFDNKANEVPAGGNPPRSGWVQDRFRANMTVPARIPKSMPNGSYLLRHEIIALHVATSRGPEFYVSCTQVRVTGGSNRSAKDQGAELVKFPGAYNPNDSGLRANVFDNGLNANSYKMPGPALFIGSNTNDPEPQPEPEPEPEPSSSTLQDGNASTTQNDKPPATTSKSSTSKPTSTKTGKPATSTSPPTKRPIRCKAKRHVIYSSLEGRSDHMSSKFSRDFVRVVQL